MGANILKERAREKGKGGQGGNKQMREKRGDGGKMRARKRKTVF